MPDLSTEDLYAMLSGGTKPPMQKRDEEVAGLHAFFSPEAEARRAKVPQYWNSPEGKARMAEMQQRKAELESSNAARRSITASLGAPAPVATSNFEKDPMHASPEDLLQYMHTLSSKAGKADRTPTLPKQPRSSMGTRD